MDVPLTTGDRQMNDDKVVKITNNANRDTIHELRDLLQCAENGAAKGFTFTMTGPDGTSRMGLRGCHAENPAYAIGTMIIMIYRIIREVVGHK